MIRSLLVAVVVSFAVAVALVVGCDNDEATYVYCPPEPEPESDDKVSVPRFESWEAVEAYARTLPRLQEYFAALDAMPKREQPELAFTTQYVAVVYDASGADVSVVDSGDCLNFVSFVMGRQPEEFLNSASIEPLAELEMDNDDIAVIWIETRSMWGGTDNFVLTWDWDGEVYLVNETHDTAAGCNVGNPWNHALLRLNGEPTCTATSNIQAAHGCGEWLVLE
jgi:hypothetical protein